MSGIGIVADDLTGGTTVGALIARAGRTPTVLFEHREIDRSVTGTEDAVIVSTESRAMEPEVAFGRVRTATAQMLGMGLDHVSKRIDTTLRGGIGAEVEGMLEALEEAGRHAIAVIVPAMPGSRRIVIGGYSVIDSELLGRTDVARDVRTPVTESHLPTLLARQFQLEVGHVPIADVLRGDAVVADRVRTLVDREVRVILADAVSEDDIATIARAVVAVGEPVVAVDPGPFTVALARCRGDVEAAPPPERENRIAASPEDRGTVAVIAGSASQRTHEQMKRLAAEPGTRVITADVLRLIGDAETFAAERHRVEAALTTAMRTSPRVALIALDSVMSGERTARADLEAASGLHGSQIATLLTRRLAALARGCLDTIGRERLAGAYLTGGDVMVAACRALGARGLEMVDYVIPQVDQARLVGGPYEKLPVVCKGGLTGTETTALEAVCRLFDETRSMQR